MNKIALITGASSGIGAATAEAFAASGKNSETIKISFFIFYFFFGQQANLKKLLVWP